MESKEAMVLSFVQVVASEPTKMLQVVSNTVRNATDGTLEIVAVGFVLAMDIMVFNQVIIIMVQINKVEKVVEVSMLLVMPEIDFLVLIYEAQIVFVDD